MSGIRALENLSAIDSSARVHATKSLSQGMEIAICGFGPVETGFGTRLNVPLSEGQIESSGDPGSFLELTREQALDLHVKLANALFAEDQEGS